MDDQRTVLIVDPSEETREVLQTVLERRGVRIFSAGRAKQGLELARNHHPDLIVLDVELEFDDPNNGQAGSNNPENRCNPFADPSRADQTPLVMLGTVRRSVDGLPEGEFVAKPYHYGPLIRRIEELLAAG